MNSAVNTALDVTSTPDLAQYALACETWLTTQANRVTWNNPAHGTAEKLNTDLTDDVAVFHSLSFQDEARLVSAAAEWHAVKFDAGYAAVDWPSELGGAGLTAEHARVFTAVEAAFDVPPDHELRRVTTNLVAPTLRAFGTNEQRQRYLCTFLRCSETVCQLFSEPGAGSDLAGLATRAVRAGDGWVVDGAKVWVSGAQFADWGLLVARTNPDVVKHAGLTAFLVPMHAPGVEVRPIRQMSGGSSFNEVFFEGLQLDDRLRIGDVGAGWKVAITMLSFERTQSGSRSGVGGSWQELAALARSRAGRYGPAVRQQLVRVYEHERIRELTRRRAQQTGERKGEVGPEGSIGKLLWVQGLTAIGEAASAVLGADLAADTGRPGTFAWAEHVLGAPGFRIAGGSDEIQRNIISERVLGLPPEPRLDAGRSWREASK